MSKLVYGVGVNDADYETQKYDAWYENGKRKSKAIWRCPYYWRWKGMLERCYSEKFHQIRPTYKGCTVSKEWHLFSNFRRWCIVQEDTFNIDIKGYELDKDILFEGNKEYSSKTCAFVHRKVNSFVIDKKSCRGRYLIGCYWCERSNRFMSRCSNSFTNESKYLGLHTTQEEAHLAWAKYKLDSTHQLIASEYCNTDPRVNEALVKKYTAILRNAEQLVAGIK